LERTDARGPGDRAREKRGWRNLPREREPRRCFTCRLSGLADVGKVLRVAPVISERPAKRRRAIGKGNGST
jgi:hypothetical protein